MSVFEGKAHMAPARTLQSLSTSLGVAGVQATFQKRFRSHNLEPSNTKTELKTTPAFLGGLFRTGTPSAGLCLLSTFGKSGHFTRRWSFQFSFIRFGQSVTN